MLIFLRSKNVRANQVPRYSGCLFDNQYVLRWDRTSFDPSGDFLRKPLCDARQLRLRGRIERGDYLQDDVTFVAFSAHDSDFINTLLRLSSGNFIDEKTINKVLTTTKMPANIEGSKDNEQRS
jgi:hypothetical protein